MLTSLTATNRYYMFNRYLLFPEKDQEKSFLSSYILEGSSDPISVPSDDRTWTVIDEAFDDGFHNYNKSVYLYAFHFPFSSLRLTMLSIRFFSFLMTSSLFKQNVCCC